MRYKDEIVSHGQIHTLAMGWFPQASEAAPSSCCCACAAGPAQTTLRVLCSQIEAGPLPTYRHCNSYLVFMFLNT